MATLIKRAKKYYSKIAVRVGTNKLNKKKIVYVRLLTDRYSYAKKRNLMVTHREHKIRAEKNKLIEPVDENYMLRNLKLPWRTTGTIAEENDNNTTIGPSDDDDEVRKKILEILEEREKNKQ